MILRTLSNRHLTSAGGGLKKQPGPKARPSRSGRLNVWERSPGYRNQPGAGERVPEQQPTLARPPRATIEPVVERACAGFRFLAVQHFCEREGERQRSARNGFDPGQGHTPKQQSGKRKGDHGTGREALPF